MTEGEVRHIVVVGLGNPGLSYALTRHNMGYLVAEELARRHGMTLKADHSFRAKVVQGIIEGHQVHIILPTTYMNLSGQAVRRYLGFYKRSARDLIVVMDDCDLDFGEVRIRERGSASGHNGLRSIQECLGTQEYLRVRMGIGHPTRSEEEAQQTLADFVLAMFSAEEREVLPALIEQGVEVVEMLIRGSIADAINMCKKKNSPPRENGSKLGEEENEGKST